VDTAPQARAYLKQYNVNYPNGPDLRTQVSQLFHIRGVPETYILNKQGELPTLRSVRLLRRMKSNRSWMDC